jgi:hypothetical protein
MEEIIEICKAGGELGNMLGERCGRHHGLEGQTNPVFLLCFYRFCFSHVCYHTASLRNAFREAIMRTNAVAQLQGVSETSRGLFACNKEVVGVLEISARLGCVPAPSFTGQARSGLANDETRVGPFLRKNTDARSNELGDAAASNGRSNTQGGQSSNSGGMQ